MANNLIVEDLSTSKRANNLLVNDQVCCQMIFVNASGKICIEILAKVFNICPQVREMRAAGKDIYHLAFGESPFPIPVCMQHALKTNVGHGEYLPVEGSILDLQIAQLIPLYFSIYVGTYLCKSTAAFFCVLSLFAIRCCSLLTILVNQRPHQCSDLLWTCSAFLFLCTGITHAGAGYSHVSMTPRLWRIYIPVHQRCLYSSRLSPCNYKYVVYI